MKNMNEPTNRGKNSIAIDTRDAHVSVGALAI